MVVYGSLSHQTMKKPYFFSYADDDDEMGPTCVVFLPSDTLQNDKNVEHKKQLETVVQGHFRALFSQLLQSEFVEVANFVKPDTSRGRSMDPGDYVKIKCIAFGNPYERIEAKRPNVLLVEKKCIFICTRVSVSQRDFTCSKCYKFSEYHEADNQFSKKPSKTLMFFDGCPRQLGCTVQD
ncbi:hypothetical protein L1887_14472 [Cichorium endivia]|nr:hypothetical protein L1887_14472 [Cichorium endivia]